MTLLGSLLIVAACAYVGDALARQKKKELALVGAFAALVSHILRRLPTKQLLCDILSDFENDVLEKSGVLYCFCNKSLPCAIELVKEDKALYQILTALASDFGSTDMERQRQSLILAETELELLVKTRRETLSEAERSYRRLGLLGGAAVAILLL